MLCTPWQLAQLATVCEPALAARPWNDESKLTRRSEGRPNLRVSRTSPWQLPQVSRMLRGVHRRSLVGVLEDLVLAVAIGAQRGLGDAAASAWPCTLARYCSTTSVWHMPQVSGTAVRKACDLGGSSSWALPWHRAQSGAPSLPPLRAWPWTPLA